MEILHHTVEGQVESPLDKVYLVCQRSTHLRVSAYSPRCVGSSVEFKLQSQSSIKDVMNQYIIKFIGDV